MAQTKPEVNRSQSIRDFVAKNPKSSVPEVVDALAKNGVEVTKNHVHVVIAKMKTKKQQRREQVTAEPSANGFAGKAPSKSSAVRSLLKENRKLTAKEVVAAMAEKGIEVAEGLVYFVKGQMKGKRGRKKHASQVVASVATATVSTNGDAVKTILKIKGWANEIGGLKKLKGLVDALSE